MVAADATHRDDPARHQSADSCIQRTRLSYGRHSLLNPINRRSTPGAGQGFSVESPVIRGGILSLARLAQREAIQSRVDSIVGQVANDRVSRATLSTIDEGVAIPARLGIVQFADAVLAARQVERQPHVALISKCARQNAK